MGVPVLRAGRVLGVVVVQNVTRRRYAEAEIEACETVAMVLAEVLATAVEERPPAAAPIVAGPALIAGLSLSRGVATGRARRVQREIVIERTLAEQLEPELARLDQAFAALSTGLEAHLQGSALPALGEHSEVLEAFKMFAEDHGWRERIADAVRGGLSAEAAVQLVQNEIRGRLSKAQDPYLRERLVDLDDLGDRLLGHLIGPLGNGAPGALVLEEPAVLIARNLGPAALLDLDPAFLEGVVLTEGSPTSHLAIVARALGVPVVGRCREALEAVAEGDLLIVDGDGGQIVVRPEPRALQAYESSIGRSRPADDFAATAALEPLSRDGRHISIELNAGFPFEVPRLDDCGAEGIGLFRTELAFMGRHSYPDVAAQAELYASVLARAGSRPVVFRTLDIGGDKALPYLETSGDANPALGWRGIRVGFDRPDILEDQLGALIRAAGQRLDVVFPMVTELAEFNHARGVLEAELEKARAASLATPADVRVGVMLEVPALLWQLRPLFAAADFVSLGSNDLLQYLFASDRDNPRVNARYDVLSAPLLGLIGEIVSAAAEAAIPLTVCGEIAGRPLEAMALVGCGIERLSMAAAEVPALKRMVRSLDVGALRGLVCDLAGQDHGSVRTAFEDFARENGVEV
jgi:phosphotransferase system enzyme I (PtsP)